MKIVFLILTIFLSYKWVKGLEQMKDLHPDYEGEDFP
jgi:hypothetical protein